jgi:hypothetical protein
MSIYFYDARIANRVDLDGDGCARQFDIEFHVDSISSGQYYVKIYEDDGSSLFDDYLTTSGSLRVSPRRCGEAPLQFGETRFEHGNPLDKQAVLLAQGQDETGQGQLVERINRLGSHPELESAPQLRVNGPPITPYRPNAPGGERLRKRALSAL